MDPLSITTGILTILGVGSTIQSGFKRILALKHAPAALIALNNEINDLHRIIRAIDDILRRDPKREDSIFISEFVKKLQTTRGVALDVEKFISYEITVVAADGQNMRIDRSKWLRSETKLQELKEKIQSNKADLSLEFGMFNSSLLIDCNITSCAILRRVEEINQDVKTSFQDVIENQDQVNAMPTYLQPHRRRQLLPVSTVPPKVQDAKEDNVEEVDSDTELDADATPYEASHNPVDSSSSVPTSGRHFLISTLAPGSCNMGCDCSCHKSRRFRSPQFLDRVFGSLFIGYRVSPVFKSSCSNLDCQLSTTRITYTYAFPQWFLKSILHSSISFAQSRGPELNLRVMNLRTEKALVFATIEWDTPEIAFETVKKLMDVREASVLDVDPDGNSLLCHAADKDKISIVKLLLERGADPFYQNSVGMSAYSIVWSYILQGFSDFRPLSELFPADDYEQLEFSALHRAVLHLPGLPFEAALEVTERSQLDSANYLGKTALMWAAERGDLGIVSRLLECGADPNKQDAHKRTALHWAAFGHQPGCIEKLILAKSSLEIPDIRGLTPLMNPGFGPRGYAALKVLLKHGAKVDHQDNQGYNALLNTVWRGHSAERLRLLVRYGADINALGQDGISALHCVIFAQNHECLQALLEYEDLQLLQKSELHSFLYFAALFGDGKTLQTLLSVIDRFEIGPDERQEMVESALPVAKSRLDENERESVFLHPFARLVEDRAAWYELFQKLCFKILNPPETRSNGWSTDGSFVDDDTTSSDCGDSSSCENEEWQDGSFVDDDHTSSDSGESSSEEEEWQDAPEPSQA